MSNIFGTSSLLNPVLEHNSRCNVIPTFQNGQDAIFMRRYTYSAAISMWSDHLSMSPEPWLGSRYSRWIVAQCHVTPPLIKPLAYSLTRRPVALRYKFLLWKNKTQITFNRKWHKSIPDPIIISKIKKRGIRMWEGVGLLNNQLRQPI